MIIEEKMFIFNGDIKIYLVILMKNILMILMILIENSDKKIGMKKINCINLSKKNKKEHDKIFLRKIRKT